VAEGTAASQVLDQSQRIVDRGVRIARRDGIADPSIRQRSACA
jgi:hypothetical protein